VSAIQKTAAPGTLVAPEKVEEIERIIAEHGLSSISQLGQISMMLAMAQGLQKLDAALTPEIMQPIMALQGSRLGFLTDKDKEGGYGQAVVKRCVIEAFLRGVRPLQNEMNIIAGQFYGTREAFVRLLKELDGLTELRLNLGVPKGSNGGAVVTCSATWKFKGKADAMDAEIPVKVNSGMGADAILGKAERKFRCRIYNRLTGSEFPEGDAVEIAAEEKVVGSGVTGSASQVRKPQPKEPAPRPAEAAPVQERSEDDLFHLHATAEEYGIPPLALDEASRKMFSGRAPRELSDPEFDTLLGWVKHGGEAK
jgi:hypothetical protein